MKAFLFFILLSFLSCGFAPINNSNYDSKKIYFTFKDNFLNNKFFKNLERNSKFLNLELTNSNEAEINIEIMNHTILKFAGATDSNFFSATGVIEYELNIFELIIL